MSAGTERRSPLEGHGHSHDDGHGHSHGLLDRSIIRSRDGLKAVGLSLGVLLVTTILQFVIFLTTGSVALLADLIHNLGDALTAVPVGIAFMMRSFVAEKKGRLLCCRCDLHQRRGCRGCRGRSAGEPADRRARPRLGPRRGNRVRR